jgi:putative methyltransferase (TIGR01177 family)
MIVGYVELSGEAPDLARAEALAAAEALGGGAAPTSGPHLAGLLPVELPDRVAIERLAGRLALARRCLVAVAWETPLRETITLAAADGLPASFRRVGGSPGGTDAGLRDAGRVYREGGGSIDLERPARRFWIAAEPSGAERLLLEVAAVDRPGHAARRMPLLPFQRPVSLAPRLARAAANLARVRPGDRVVDPFLGTGALLAEAALLGARTYGIDRDPAMVVGALRNFAHLGVEVAEIVEGDAGAAEFRDPAQRFHAVLTDPPYGRSSATGGEAAAAVLGRVLPRWAERVLPGRRVVVVAPSGTPTLDRPWVERLRVPLRVHRSLIREFRVYERSG